MLANDTLYATCAAGLQPLLANELSSFGAQSVSTAGAGVRFNGDLSVAYKACLWSRVANRILLPIYEGPADSPEALYALIKKIDWSQHMALHGTLAVDFFTANSAITHSQYGALKVKDAVVDQFRENTGERPNVDRDTPDLRINVYLFRNKARVAIDLSGTSLHRRGYREQAGPAPIKENLAAALLLHCDWPARAARSEPFMDPLCGSGTLAIEAAMIACQIAPGLKRSHYGFSGWLGHDKTLWEGILGDAQQQVQAAPCEIRGADKDKRAIAIAIENAAIAGVEKELSFSNADLLKQEFSVSSVAGLVLSNPPYGQRLEADDSFYQQLGSALSAGYAGWHCGLFSATEAPMRQARLPIKPSLQARNGSIECALFEGLIPSMSANTVKSAVRTDFASDSLEQSAQTAQVRSGSAVWSQALANKESANTQSGDATLSNEPSHSDASAVRVDITPFENRVKKNVKRLKSWHKREQINAYRVYDADLPEFAVAIDLYDCDERHVVVQEYQAPASVNVAVAAARLNAVLEVVPDLFGVDSDRMHVKVREKQSGLSQYQKQSSSKVTGLLNECGYKLECNFSDYLDTGVFLDHRKVRQFLHLNSNEKRFLNLFSYTGSASIAAATGGAVETVSVDLSNRYSQWLTRNLMHNRLDDRQNHVIKSDVCKWLSENKNQRFDLILLDPPTFSNSTGIDADWNVQRDHQRCIRDCMELLEPDGVLVFSNNYRRFKLDEALGQVRPQKGGKRKASSEPSSSGSQNDTKRKSDSIQFDIEDRTHWSIDQDFQRNSRIHQCWFIRHVS